VKVDEEVSQEEGTVKEEVEEIEEEKSEE